MRPNTTEVRFKDEYLATAILRWRLRARSGKAAQREAQSCIVTWDEAREPVLSGWYKPVVFVTPLGKTRLAGRRSARRARQRKD